MIYRIEREPPKVYEVLDWKLYSADHERIGLKSEEELRAFLKNHPEEDFFLVPAPYMNREIQGTDPAMFEPSLQDIRCGIVRYDSALDRVVTRDAMKVTYTDRVKNWPQGFALLRQATQYLGEALGTAAASVMATWDRRDDQNGRILFILMLSDWTGTYSAVFSPEELQSESQDSYFWHRLWGDFLQDKSHRQLAELTSGGI
jgi:hypothetical protein